ncbi:helix-turn-helix transcriptional regulator [Streptacidiphilus sp. P02-A3a]|nr:helix-turn-helix transcriptional regulator [Streptacidiphilus sp. P02-A3a]
MPAGSLRADARRNRARVLEAAQAAFATEGLSVPLDEIARRAGVGAGTVHRHFPSKEALFEAVMVNRLQQYIDSARELAASGRPGAALFDFLSRMTEQAAMKKDLADALAGAGIDVSGATSAVTQELRDAIGTLLVQAQQAGTVRPDVGNAQLMALVAGVFLATRRSSDPRFAEQVMTVVLDGLRTGAPAAGAGTP